MGYHPAARIRSSRLLSATRPELVVATNNPGKLREIRRLLSDLPARLITLAEAGVQSEAPEDGATFQENAVAKARFYARQSGRLTLADDSGLEVDALDGQPGAQSARYGGPGLSDRDRTELVLLHLAGLPPGRRTARFRCVVAVATPDGRAETAEGTIEGQIALAPRGSGGFGYDPIFLLPDLGRTVAELGPEEKNRISHRARAIQAIQPVLVDLCKDECHE